VAGVGQQREGVDLPSVERLDRDEEDVDADADRERPVEVRGRMVMRMVVGVPMVRVVIIVIVVMSMTVVVCVLFCHAVSVTAQQRPAALRFDTHRRMRRSRGGPDSRRAVPPVVSRAMDRHQLDRLSTRHSLSASAIAQALHLTGLSPDAAAWRAFAATMLRAAGLAALGAGLLFFVAANWQDYGVLGRFALLQCLLVASITAALWRSPPAWHGQAALVLATLLTGGLLALFGQSYQTGADLYELFFTWAALSLPFALAGLSGALWAVWWCVLNVGLALFSGTMLSQRVISWLVLGWGVDISSLLIALCVVNLSAAAAFVGLRKTRLAQAAPLWLARGLAAVGMAYGTVAALVAIVSPRGDDASHAGAVLLAFTLISGAIAFATLRHKRDVFPMALISASWIAISTTWIAHTIRFDDIGAFFVIALWLIGISTAAGWLLMRWVRAWSAPVVLDLPGASS
jgi:uncharacterized membrane protein